MLPWCRRHLAHAACTAQHRPLTFARTRPMLTDLTLASLHHLLFFAVIAMLATESVLLRGRVDGPTIQRLAGVDLGYGLSAMALIVVGVARIVYGVKGHDFYLHNPWFHAKMATFVLVFAFSIRPTVVFLR